MPRNKDVWDDAIYSMRTSGVKTVKRGGLIIAAFAVIAGVYLCFVFYTQVRPSIPSAENVSTIPSSAVAAGVIEAATCVQQGPSECKDYTEARDFMVGAPSGQSLEYQPLNPTDPGEDVGNGLKSITLSKDTPDQDIQAVAAAMTLGGAATPLNVTDKTIKTSGEHNSTATFSITRPDGTEATGTIKFVITNSDLRLAQVTYASAG